MIRSVSENGFLYEEGPNSGVIANAEVLHLFEALGTECEMEVAGGTVKKRYVLKDDKWEALPGGLKAAVTTPLFTLKDKFRILLEPFRPKGKDPHETLAGLVRRRLGKSFLNYAIDPFIIGVYAGDPGRLVPKYALKPISWSNNTAVLSEEPSKTVSAQNRGDEEVARGIFCQGAYRF